MANAVKSLFLTQLLRCDTAFEVDEGDISVVTLGEVAEAREKLAIGKAPEPDNVPPEVVKMLIEEWPMIFQKLANDTLQRGRFPDVQKEANLVLIPEPGNKIASTGFRPIFLLNTAAKTMESIVIAR